MSKESILLLSGSDLADSSRFYVGIDCYDKAGTEGSVTVWSLVRKTENSMEVIHSKTMKPNMEFKDEVLNVSKYFNAPIVGNKTDLENFNDIK